MPTTTLGRRLDGVGRVLAPEQLFQFAVVIPEVWPGSIRAAYEAAQASGDHARLADIVAAQTGIRPTFPRPGEASRQTTPPIIEIRSRPDGPQ